MNNHPTTATALSVTGAADVVAGSAASAAQADASPPATVVGNNDSVARGGAAIAGHVFPSIPPFTTLDANQLTAAVAAALASLPPSGDGATTDRSPSDDGATTTTTTTNKKKRKKGGGKTKKDDTKKPKKKGKKGVNFTRAESLNFLELVDEADKFPLCITAWDEIAEKHSESYPLTERDGEGLCRKFNALANIKMPTGDPRIPPEVKIAKKLRWQMGNSAGLKTGSPEKAVDLTNIHVDGGAYRDQDDDNDEVDFSGGGPDYDGEEDDNDDDESNDDDDDDDDDDDEEDDDDVPISSTWACLKACLRVSVLHFAPGHHCVQFVLNIVMTPL